MREELPFSDEVLQTLHNLGDTAKGFGSTVDDIAKVLGRDRFEIENILDKYQIEGFAESFVDSEGKKRYFLNSKGIIRVCSLFT